MPPRRSLVPVAVTLVCAAAAGRAAAGPAKLDVRAGAIALYPYAARTLLTADGGVVVRIGDRTIAADAVRLDLSHDRLVAAGNVRVTRGRGVLTGNAYAVDLRSGAAVLMRLDPVPGTFRVRGDDAASEVAAPLPPGAFDADDLDGERPYVRAHRAIVTLHGAVRMTPAEFPTAAGPSVTVPAFVYTLVANPYIAQSAAPSASFAQPYLLAGTTNSITAANVRYDGQNGMTLGLDEHLVDGDRAYVAASVLPFRDRQFDVTAFDAIRHGLQQTLTATQTIGRGATTAATYRLQASGALAVETLQAVAFDGSTSVGFDASTYAHDVGRYFSYQVHAGYAYDHNAGGEPYADDLRANAGGFVASPTVTVFGSSVNAKFDYALTAYDDPHEVTDANLTFTFGRALGNNVRTLATVAFGQDDNRYRDLATGAIAFGLPDPDLPSYVPDGTASAGYLSYASPTTYRTYALQTTILGRGDDRVQVTLTHTRDFPRDHGYGRAPFDLDLDVKHRITRTLSAEIGRSYDFGWDGQYLSPQYYLGISP